MTRIPSRDQAKDTFGVRYFTAEAQRPAENRKNKLFYLSASAVKYATESPTGVIACGLYFASLKTAIIRDGIQLLPEKAIFFPKEKVLVAADLHFGKINHFRQAGLPVPRSANQKNAETLIDLINYWKPERMIFLGDLFHSHYNEEWEVVGQIVKHFPTCSFELVMGNHDIMSELQYRRKGIKVIEQQIINQWILTHEPMDTSEIPAGKINMAGHLHPGAFLEGKGRQSVTLACFWFSKNQLIIPAFGSFTGLAIIDPSENDNVYIVLEDNVMEVTLAPSRGKSKTTR